MYCIRSTNFRPLLRHRTHTVQVTFGRDIEKRAVRHGVHVSASARALLLTLLGKSYATAQHMSCANLRLRFSFVRARLL